MSTYRRPHLTATQNWMEDHPVIVTLAFTLTAFAASALIVFDLS